MDTADPGTWSDGPKLPLSGLVGTSRRWEAMAVPIGRNLRRASWLAGLVTALSLALAFHYPDWVQEAESKPDLFLFGWPQLVAIADTSPLLLVGAPATCLVVLVAAAVLTSGFREAGPRLQGGCAVADATAGLAALPTAGVALIVIVNLAIWIVGFLILLALAVAIGSALANP